MRGKKIQHPGGNDACISLWVVIPAQKSRYLQEHDLEFLHVLASGQLYWLSCGATYGFREDFSRQMRAFYDVRQTNIADCRISFCRITSQRVVQLQAVNTREVSKCFRPLISLEFRRYLSTWLALDVASTLPFTLLAFIFTGKIGRGFTYSLLNMLRLWRLRRVGSLFARSALLNSVKFQKVPAFVAHIGHYGR